MPSGGGPGGGPCLPKSQAYPTRTAPLVQALQLELGDVKVVDPRNRGAHLHPLSNHHPTHCREHLGQDCAQQDSVLPEFKSIYYTRYRTRYRYY